MGVQAVVLTNFYHPPPAPPIKGGEKCMALKGRADQDKKSPAQVHRALVIRRVEQAFRSGSRCHPAW
ncbi:hypothetical protein JCM15764A_29690 [Geotalea toluenoxydans]